MHIYNLDFADAHYWHHTIFKVNKKMNANVTPIIISMIIWVKVDNHDSNIYIYMYDDCIS